MTRQRLLVTIAVVAIVVVALLVRRSVRGPGVVVLENGKTHYGKTYPEWAAAWWRWQYEMPPKPPCALLLDDTTGERCAEGQPPDMFFLAGTLGGKVVRTKCVVPRGRPIFFPVFNVIQDNAGIPPAEQMTNDRLALTVTEMTSKVTSLVAKVDGAALDVARFRVDATEFSYTLPPEPNFYSCMGQHGVTGKVVSFHAGYWVMLAPLPPGPHEIAFAARVPMTQGDVVVDVTYQLRVE